MPIYIDEQEKDRLEKEFDSKQDQPINAQVFVLRNKVKQLENSLLNLEIKLKKLIQIINKRKA